MKAILGLFFKEVVEDAAKKTAQQSLVNAAQEEVRREFLRTVAEGYTREVEYNLSQYIRAVGSMSATIEFDQELTSERLFTALKSSLDRLGVELEQAGPDSAIVQYLKTRYTPEPSLFVGRESTSVADMLGGDKRQEIWLNRTGSIELPESISIEVARLLDEILQDELP